MSYGVGGNFTTTIQVDRSFPTFFYCRYGLRSIRCRFVKHSKPDYQITFPRWPLHVLYHSFKRCSKCRPKFSGGAKGFPRSIHTLEFPRCTVSPVHIPWEFPTCDMRQRFQDSSQHCKMRIENRNGRQKFGDMMLEL